MHLSTVSHRGRPREESDLGFVSLTTSREGTPMWYRTVTSFATVAAAAAILGTMCVSTDALARAAGVRAGGVHAGAAYRGGAYRGGAAYRGGVYRGGVGYVGRGVGV